VQRERWGGKLERPALRRLLSRCVQGRVDVVVVTSLDRLVRKMSDGVRLNDWLKQASVEPGDPVGVLNRLQSGGERRTNPLTLTPPSGPEAVGFVHPNGPALFLDRGLMLWGKLDRIGRVDVQPVNCQ